MNDRSLIDIFSIEDLVSRSWKLFVNNYVKVVSTILIAIIIQMIANYAISSGGINELSDISLNFIITYIVSLLISAAINLGLLKIFLRLYDEGDFEIKELFNNIGMVPHYLVITIISTLLIFMGLLLFILPGIYFFLRFFFAVIALVDLNLTNPIEALKKSSELTKNVKLKLLMISLFLVFLNLAGILFFGIGLLITAPISFIMIIDIYKSLQEYYNKESQSPGDVTESEGTQEVS